MFCSRVEFSVYKYLISIICRTLPQISSEILRLAVKYKDQGVVGIDLSGDEEGLNPDDPDMFSPEVEEV